jgi:hypothetical protein
MEPVNVSVKYLGKSKRNFAVRPHGVEYKFKPGQMTHLEMERADADALIAEKPEVWAIEDIGAMYASGVDAATDAQDYTVLSDFGEHPFQRRKRKLNEGR